MPHFVFTLNSEDEMQKSTHKYIQRYPKKSGDGWWYVYAQDLKKPFKALMTIFGLNKDRISKDYENNNIQKDYGVNKDSFAAHILRYFTKKDFYNDKFSNPDISKKFKKPVNEKKTTSVSKTDKTAKTNPSDKPKWNNSLLRKIWSIYNPDAAANVDKKIEQIEKRPVEEIADDNSENKLNDVIDNIVDNVNESEFEEHENRSDAMIGNQNAKKDGITDKTDYTINGGNADEGNNNLTQQEGISGTSEQVQHGNTVGNGSKDVSETEHGNNGSELELGTYKPGIGLTESGSDDVNTGRGRVTKARARKIREQCREILKKSDDEITESDKEILRQYVGAGGTDEKDASNSGVLYEFYTPYNVINKVWQLVDKYNPKLDKTVIEPSSGIGRFAENRSEKFTMFELEEESARIAHILKPDATVIQGAFQKNFMKQENGIFTKPYEQFDVAVGNPPYGDYKGYYKGKGEGKDFKRYDSYFISRTIDTLKDGGILAMVIPQGMLNGSSSYGKDIEKIAGKAKLLEAWRLPNGTFDSTDVGTDIVIFRKESGGNVNDIVGYFERNPDHIAGEKSTRIGRFGEETYIKVKDGDTFESAVDNIPVGQAEIEKEIADEVKKVETEIDDKKTLSYGDEVNTPSGKGIITGFKKTNGKITGYIARVNGEKVNIKVKKTDAEKHRNRSDAMKGNKNAEGKHVTSPDARIMSAEEFNQKYGKSFSTEDLPIWKATDKYGNVDISKLSESELEYVKKSENYVFDNGNYINKVNYASGNIRQKIKELDENDPQYEMKKSILESEMPETKHVGKLITYYEKDAFGNDVKKNRFEGFTLSPITDWARDYRTKDGADLISLFKDWAYGGGAYFDESTSPITAEEIPPEISWRDILAFINREPVRLDRGDRSDNKKDNDRFKLMKKEKRQETAIRLFNRFLSEGLTLDYKRDLENAWNDNFNTYVNPDYTKIPIFVDGMSTHKGAKEFILTKQQIKGVTQLTNKGTGLLAYDVGVGKALANSEKVLTPNGWVENGSLKPGDCVIGDDGKAAVIGKVFPQGIQNIYKVTFSDGSEVRCTREHLWNVQLPYMRNKAQSKGKSIFKTIELQDFWNDLHNYRGERKYSIPMCKPVQFNARSLLIDPYLMGVLLGDGCFSSKSISLTIADDFIKDKISTMLNGCTLHHKGKYDYRITYGDGNPITNAIKQYNLFNCHSDNKFIPEDYIYNTVENRIALLNGLFDTDGYIDNRGYTTLYYTTSKLLANGIKQIVQSLGGTVSINGKNGKYKKNGVTINCKYCYCISVKLDGINPFTLPKKAERVVEKTKYKPIRYIEKVEFDCQEEATCIWVENESHLYITSDYVVTHNTPTGIVATVNQIQTERAKRPLICVPKPVYKNWIKSIHQLFPEIKVNELGNLSKNFIDSDFVPEEGSISVCTYEGIENISFSEEQEEMLKNDVEFNYMRESKSGKESARSKASADEKNEETVGAIAKTRGEGISLAQLGFDHITVDEVHNFRNLFTVPRRIDIKGDDDEKNQSNEFSSLGSGTPSDRALKLFGITQVIQHENDGRNVFLLSATPFQNSPIEIYSILSYMARDKLRDMGIYSIEQFVSQFCKLQSEMVVKANKIDEKLVMKDFNNLSALQNLITEYIDKVDGEEAGVIRPYKRTHTPELEMTELQKAIMDECNDYIEVQESLPKNDRDPGYMFRAMNAMRNCTLSPALVSIDFIPDGYEKPAADKVVDSSPKLKFVCDSIIAQYKNNNSEGQVIYMPSGVEYFPEVRNYLVKHGVPKDAVALMSGGATSDKQMEARQNVMDDFNNPEGKTKIIIGSSAIKEGVNLQGNSTVIYNTQLDWNPTDAQQVEGRIWRQGNRQGITHVVYPLMSDSIDAMIYQKYDEKATRLDALYSYKGDELNVSDINPEELKFGLIKDPVKRARVMVSKYKEKAESEEKMYGQLYDVLYKQKNTAFENDESVKERVLSNFRYDNPVNYNWTPEVSESNIGFLTEKKKEYEDMKKKFMKENKRDTFDVSEAKSGKYDTSETTLRYEWRQGAVAYDAILKTFDEKIESKNELISRNRKLITKFNNLMKNEFGKRDTLRDNLSSKGIKTPEDAERKMEEYSTLRIEAKEQIEKSKDMYNEFLEQAIKDNETRKKVIPSLEKQIKTNIESIRNDLHPMDAEWKAKIKDENEKRFGIQKSLFFRDSKLIFGLHF